MKNMEQQGSQSRKGLGTALAIVATLLTILAAFTLLLSPFSEIRHGQFPEKVLIQYIANPWITWLAVLVVGTLLAWLGMVRKIGSRYQLMTLLGAAAVAIGLAVISNMLALPPSQVL
jgi:uncharacterized membrane protein HdeD (DUF308 family)